jgi:hypothetical protein
MPSSFRPPEISHPPYLPNGDRLGKNKCTMMIRTLINGGVGHLKTSKKKPNFGGNTHVTLNPKPFRTLINGGVRHLKTSKKKLNFGGDTHVTLNPKPLNPKP